MAILDDGAVQSRTSDVTRLIADNLLKNPAVETVMSINGLDITSMSPKSNYGTFFATLKPGANARPRKAAPRPSVPASWP